MSASAGHLSGLLSKSDILSFSVSSRSPSVGFDSTMRVILKWSPQKATRATAHIPEKAGELCLRAFFRLVYAIKWENIPPEVH